MTEQDEQIAASASPVSVDEPMLNRAAWLRILPFLTYVFFIFAGDMLERMGYSAASLRLLYPVKIGAVAVLLAFSWRHYEELRRAAPGPKVALVALAAGVAVLLLWISLDAPWMIVGSNQGYDPRVDGQVDWPLAVVRIAGAALVVPVMEELFWRSFLMRWIEASDFQSVDPSQLGLKSFAITIVLFGFEHDLWLAGMVAGAVYGWLYWRTRSLWPPIIAHAVTNGLLGIWVVATGNWWFW
ncbi:MAG: CAAX prenyl protease-related protein [Telluria sp.]